MKDGFIINIPRPVPETDENERLISFVEPLRKAERIKVSSAYFFNLKQFEKNGECSWSPGFRYEFFFPVEEDATAFKLAFGGEEVK